MQQFNGGPGPPAAPVQSPPTNQPTIFMELTHVSYTWVPHKLRRVSNSLSLNLEATPPVLPLPRPRANLEIDSAGSTPLQKSMHVYICVRVLCVCVCFVCPLDVFHALPLYKA